MAIINRVGKEVTKEATKAKVSFLYTGDKIMNRHSYINRISGCSAENDVDESWQVGIDQLYRTPQRLRNTKLGVKVALRTPKNIRKSVNIAKRSPRNIKQSAGKYRNLPVLVASSPYRVGRGVAKKKVKKLSAIATANKKVVTAVLTSKLLIVLIVVCSLAAVANE